MLNRLSLAAAFCLSIAISAKAFADHATLKDIGMKLYDCTLSVADDDTRKTLGKPVVHIFDFSAKEAVRQSLIANEYLTPAISGKYGLVLFSTVTHGFDNFKVGDSVVVYGSECELSATYK
jgi:hypothetical protein